MCPRCGGGPPLELLDARADLDLGVAVPMHPAMLDPTPVVPLSVAAA